MMDDLARAFWAKDAQRGIRTVPVGAKETIETGDVVDVKVREEEHLDDLNVGPWHPVQTTLATIKQQPVL
jgi:hypothetical protein